MTANGRARAPLAAQRRRRSIGPKGREKFLECLATGWSVAHAANHAGHARQRFYELREADEAFAAEWDNAWEAGTDALEDELRRRALGYDEETFDGEGNLIRKVRRHSDQSLIQALKARRPDRHREGAQVAVNTLGATYVRDVDAAAGRFDDRMAVDRSASLADVAKVLHQAGAFDAMEGFLDGVREAMDRRPADVLELPPGSVTEVEP